MDYQSKNHAKSLILSHLMFVCKDRKKRLIFSGNEVKQVFEKIATRLDCSFEALEVDQDHIHCLVKSEPRMRTAGHRPQTETYLDHATLAKALRNALKRQFWKERTFWSDGTSAAPSGMQARRLFASTLKARDRRKERRSSTRLKTSWFSRRPPRIKKQLPLIRKIFSHLSVDISQRPLLSDVMVWISFAVMRT